MSESNSNLPAPDPASSGPTPPGPATPAASPPILIGYTPPPPLRDPPPEPRRRSRHAYDENVWTGTLANLSMVLGLLSLILFPAGFFLGALGTVGLVLFLLPFLLSPVAIALATVCLRRIRRNPYAGGKGQAITGAATGAAGLVGLLLAAAILVPSIVRAREMERRALCAGNLKRLMRAMCVYASDNLDTFPTVTPSTSGTYSYFRNSGPVAAPEGPQHPVEAAIKAMYQDGPTSCQGDITACLWLTVLRNGLAPRQFICPSDPFVDPASPARVKEATAYYTNFNGAAGARRPDTTLSYSVAYPWANDPDRRNTGLCWRNSDRGDLPIIADMAPLQGTGRPAANVTNPSARSANSGNHDREGQTVVYGDAHVSFERRPDIGQNNDNIWTVGGAGPSPSGTPVPGDGRVPGYAPRNASPLDIVMVPVRNLDDGSVR